MTDPETIPGWFRAADADPIAAGCRMIGATGTLLEIGTWCGRSTAMLAQRLPEWNIWTVDAYLRDAVEFWGRDLPNHPQALAAENLAGIANVRRIVADSLDAPFYLPRPPDALFIDGDHTRERVALELRRFLPWLPAHAAVWIHDCDWIGVLDGIDDGMPSGWDRVPAYECEAQFLRCYRRAQT